VTIILTLALIFTALQVLCIGHVKSKRWLSVPQQTYQVQIPNRYTTDFTTCQLPKFTSTKVKIGKHRCSSFLGSTNYILSHDSFMALRARTVLGSWHRIVLEVDIDVSEERILSIFSAYPEDGDDILFRKVGVYFTDYIVPQYIRTQSQHRLLCPIQEKNPTQKRLVRS
jgi:hypothetical protein